MTPDMSDKSKKRALEKGLSSELLDSLQYQDAPTDETTPGSVNRLKRMNERIRCRKGQTIKPRTTAAPRPSPKVGTPSTAMGTHPSPIDLSVNKEHKLPADEGERRIRLGLCLYCDGAGHAANGCSKKSAYRLLRAAAATTAAAPAAAAAYAPGKEKY